METTSAVSKPRKRALEDDDERHVSPEGPSENENISPRLLDAQVGLPTYSVERTRIGGTVKSRRLNIDQDEASDQFAVKLPGLSDSVSPVVRAFMSDTETARSPSHAGSAAFVSSPFEMKKVAGGLGRPMFAPGGTQSHGRPTIPTLGTKGFVSEQKMSPLGHLRRLDGRVGVSPIRSQEQKSPVLQGRVTGEKPLGVCGLPTISHFLGVSGQEQSSINPAFGSLDSPYRVPMIASTTTPCSKQDIKRQPFPFSPRRNFETTKGVRTPVLDSGGMPNVSNAPPLSFDGNDLSSDEELIGIPGPDIPDPEVSFSQDKLGDLSVTENNLEESVVLSLCDGLANNLTKAERDRMELLNLFTIALAKQPSPIILGREQFQDVFGDNIRGGTLSLLSRRHCLIHVENVSSRNGSTRMGIKVRIEDTSTNGTWVNGVQLKNGQTHELELDDIVTLLRIRRGEDDVSLEYKLTRSGSPHRKKIRTSRHDGRYVRPSDKFSCVSSDMSNHHGLSPVQECDVASVHTISARAITQEMRHHIPAGSFNPVEEQFSITREVETSKAGLAQQSPMLSRKIRCTILYADQSTQDFSESSQPLEEANFDYREELSEVLSAFASIRAFDASSYHCATTDSIKEALHGSSDVLFYTGGGDEDHLVVEAPNGLSARLEKNDVFRLLCGAKNATGKLIVVISRSREAALLFADCGASHVCFLSSASKHSLRVTAFIRALVAGLLKGFSIEKSYILAEFVALNDLFPIMRPSDRICEMLPSSKQHTIQIGSAFTEAVPDRNAMALLNGPFIPVLATHFLGRDAVVRKIKAALAQNVRVCNIYGARGVGKSSIAIHIAKMSYRTRSYQNGVYYFAVNKLVEHIQNDVQPTYIDSHSQEQEDALPKVMREIETLLRSLPEADPANFPTTLVVLDDCDAVLPALEVFVLSTVRTFPGVQVLLTSTEHVRMDTDYGEIMPEQAFYVEGLGKLDSAKLFFKQARGHLTSRQFRQHFPDSSIETISNDKRLLGTKGNPFWISRLVYELESQAASN